MPRGGKKKKRGNSSEGGGAAASADDEAARAEALSRMGAFTDGILSHMTDRFEENCGSRAMAEFQVQCT